MAKPPPSVPDIEQAVLGMALSDQEVAENIVSILPEGNFYSPKHEMIYDTIRTMLGDNDPVDIITVSQRMTEENTLDKVGGAYYLTELTTDFHPPSNVDYYCRILMEYAMRRKAHTHLVQAVSNVYDLQRDVFDELSDIQQSLFDIESGTVSNGIVTLDNKLTEAYQHLEEIDGVPDGLTGFGTGFKELDDMTGGFQKGELIILAARPSMGKTAFALDIARNAYKLYGKKVGIFSFEMSSKRLANRILTSEARVDATTAKRGRMSKDEWEDIREARNRLRGIDILIDDAHDVSLGSLLSRARRMVREGVELIIVDYLQLMSARLDYQGNREQVIAKISRALKTLAEELGIPVLALSQLSRAVEQRPNKRPQLSDLRESGAIEQDADIVIFIYRAERYGIEVDDNGNSTRGIADIIVGKNRDGAIGNVTLTFIDKYARFENFISYHPVEDVRPEENRNQTEFSW